MEVGPNKHLEDVELARLLEEARQGDPAQYVSELHPHLAVCESCRENFEELALLDLPLDNLKTVEVSTRQADCPVPGLWREIAGGLTPPEKTLLHLDHASRCGHCGPLLRSAVAELTALNGQMTDAEREHIATLESAREEWQSSLARQIVGAPPLRNRKVDESMHLWSTGFRAAAAGLCLVAIIGVGSWFALQRNQPAAATRMLASAYTEKRSLELRIAGAEYAPMRVSRGAQNSFTSHPASLLKAEALIATQLESHPSDPSWLQAKAQADLLDGRYDDAANTLRRALQLTPAAPPLLIDLATANFQRALETDRKEDFGAAYEYLSQALKQNPDDQVALFNRAIVSERQFLFQQALEDWDHYLRIDNSSPWAEEARTRVSAIREKLKQHSSLATPLLSPAQLIARSNDAVLTAEVDNRIEEYLHEAVRSWLPQAFPEGQKPGMIADQSASQALFFLADLTSHQHGDQWLSDLLRGTSARAADFSQAVNALAAAVKANDAAEYDLSVQQAALAERLFRNSNNPAGMWDARFEQIFAEQADGQSELCRQGAVAAQKGSAGHSYSHLQIQLALEEGVCSGLMNDPGTYEKDANRAAEMARSNGYGALYLRAIGFAAETRFSAGDDSGGIKLVNTGLARYWSNQYPAMRGYNFYTELAYNAGEAGRFDLCTAALAEALSVIDPSSNFLLRATANTEMANAATAAHLPKIAQSRYTEAARLFSLAPQNRASLNHALESEVRAAQLDENQGRFDGGVARLARIHEQVQSLSDSFLSQMFYSTLGELQLSRHRNIEAEQALRRALALAEHELATLGSEAERTTWTEVAAPIYLALVEAELAQGHTRDALESYEWYLGAPQRMSPGLPATQAISQSTNASSAPALPQIAARLPRLTQETVLVYATLPDGLAIWVYDNRGVNARWIPQPHDNNSLQELAGRFHELTSDPESELIALHRDSRSLYNSLIAPVEQYLAPKRTLVIETDGWLAQIPFEALIDSNNRYLIERAPIVHSLGRDSQARLHNESDNDATGISRDLSALVVGSSASAAADGLVPLPDVAAEADAVAREFHSVRELKGPQATLSVLHNTLPKAAVFHFAGHSLATRERSGLMLHNSGGQPASSLLDADELRRIKLPYLRLAVLSACNTGEGIADVGGFNNVTGAFLRAGVPHVVASRWAVDSAQSRRFVEDLYTHLLSGTPVSESIQMSSLRMLSNPQTSHPFYWSAFAAYGER